MLFEYQTIGESVVDRRHVRTPLPNNRGPCWNVDLQGPLLLDPGCRGFEAGTRGSGEIIPQPLSHAPEACPCA